MTTQIKKVFAELYTLLEDNKDMKVKALLPQIMEIVTAKQMAKTFRLNEAGEVTHVYCWYHKMWEDISVAEYGSKPKTASALNSMCKEGVNQWTKQQRDYKKGKEDILDKLTKGTMTPDQIQAELVELEKVKDVIVPRKDNHGSVE